MSQKKDQNQTRRGTEESVGFPSPSLPSVSLGSSEKKILMYLLNLDGGRFNRNQAERDTHIARTTIRDILERLARKGFVDKIELTGEPGGYCNYVINDTGKAFLEATSGKKEGVGFSRGGSRNRENLSIHYHDFKLQIKDKSNFSIQKLRSLKPDVCKENFIPNLYQIFAVFKYKAAQVTLIINPKQAIIRIHDFFTTDVDQGDLFSFSKAVQFASRLEKIGIISEGMVMEVGHFARVESALSAALQRIDDKYFIELENGQKFWIDCSHGLEDETNSKDIRQKVDQLIEDVVKCNSRFSDIDKIKEALGYLTIVSRDLVNFSLPPNDDEGPDYFG